MIVIHFDLYFLEYSVAICSGVSLTQARFEKYLEEKCQLSATYEIKMIRIKCITLNASYESAISDISSE